jgi:hypothetical protein
VSNFSLELSHDVYWMDFSDVKALITGGKATSKTATVRRLAEGRASFERVPFCETSKLFEELAPENEGVVTSLGDNGEHEQCGMRDDSGVRVMDLIRIIDYLDLPGKSVCGYHRYL